MFTYSRCWRVSTSVSYLAELLVYLTCVLVVFLSALAPVAISLVLLEEYPGVGEHAQRNRTLESIVPPERPLLIFTPSLDAATRHYLQDQSEEPPIRFFLLLVLRRHRIVQSETRDGDCQTRNTMIRVDQTWCDSLYGTWSLRSEWNRTIRRELGPKVLHSALKQRHRSCLSTKCASAVAFLKHAYERTLGQSQVMGLSAGYGPASVFKTSPTAYRSH